ncbi:MAG: hypothetical protein HKL90_12250 [Elusimicrobia bacterium]|nr:hypothetical protein [Elusimicrobiota bacterium]
MLRVAAAIALGVLACRASAASLSTSPDPLPSPRWGAAVAAYDGKLYLFGGVHGRWLSDVLRLDPKTGHWSTVGSLPLPRAAAAAAVKDGHIYLSGGSVFIESGASTNDVLIFNPRTGAWKTGPLMNQARFSHDLLLLKGRLYAFGGMGAAGVVTTYERLSHDHWSVSGVVSNPFYARASAEVAGKAYFAGGVDGIPGVDHRHAELDVYDPDSDTWTRQAAMPTAREAAATAVLNGKIFVVGGDGEDHQPLATVEVYDPLSNAWSTAPAMPTPRRNAAAAVLDGKLYVMGGAGAASGAAGLDTVEVYDPNTGRWTQSSNSRHLTQPLPIAPPNRTYAPPIIVQPAPVFAPTVRFAAKAATRPHDYAVVVGVGRYERLPPTDFAEDDARDATAALIALGVPEENVVTLSGSHAAMTEVVKYVEEWLPRHVSADSRVYFYYSGHGAPNILDGVPYLMPWDADASFVKSTGLPLERLYTALGKLPARNVIAMIDACFSGAGGRSVLAPGTRPLVTVRAPKRVPPNISILTASGSDEIAGSAPQFRHGLFSYYVLRGLSGDADTTGTGHVTLEQLYAYVHKHVILDARRQNREQTPTLTSPRPNLRLY